jgi:hypothetical protein
MRLGLVCGIGLLCLQGCDSGKRDPEYEQQLKAFADAYHTYAAQNRMSPGGLAALKSSWGNYARVYDDIVAGQFIIIWNAELERTAAENDKYVLGYEAGVPEQGGLVLLGGGSVRRMSAEEFGQLKRFKDETKRG